MMKQANKNILNVPKLRFPEFKDNWQEKKIIDIGNIIGGGTPDTFNKSYWSNDIIWLTPTEVKTKYIDNSKRKISHLGLQKSSAKILPINTLLITTRATIGDIGISKIECATNQGFQSLIVDKVNNYEYWYYYLILNKIELIRRASGSTFFEISKKEIEKIEVLAPLLPEQQKIADCLTSLDDIIAAQNQKLNILKTHKKGLMQNLFPANGKTTPKLRFPEFKDNWQEKKLGDIGEFKTSSVDKKIVEGEKLVQLVNYMNVYKHENINNSYIKNLMTVSANKTQLNSSNLKKGDILFTPSSETPEDIGRSVVIFEDLKNTLYSYHLMRFRPKVQLDILYSHYFCNISNVLHQVSNVASGITRFTISVGGFSNIRVSIPSVIEQTKIANCLTSLDDIITAQTKKIDTFKAHKKGLMQQLFPSADEISK